MAKKKKEEATPGAPLWMCTFSDMMSLLLCFFVLLFAMSTIEKRKFYQAIGSIKGAMGKIPELFSMSMIQPTIRDPQKKVKPLNKRVIERAKDAIAKKEREVLIAEKMDHQIKIVGVPEGIRFHIEDSALFARGSYELTESGEIMLASVGLRLLEYPDNKIRIEGHTDNVPVTPNERFQDNWELSEKRALTVVEFLEEFFFEQEKQQRIPETLARERAHNRLALEADGQYRPIASNDTPEGRALNRRVDIVLLESAESEYVEGEGPDIPVNRQRQVPLREVRPDLRGLPQTP